MVIPKRHGIILKSKAAGNSEDRPDNSAIIFFEYIPLENLFSVLVLQPRVLADGVRINGKTIQITRCAFSLYVILFYTTDHRYYE